MLKAVRELGEFEVSESKLDPIEILVDEPMDKELVQNGEAKVVFVDFSLVEQDLSYKGVHLEDYQLEKRGKYLYRDHPSHRFRITPTDRITTVDKTFSRVTRWFDKKIGEWSEKYNQEYSHHFLVKNISEEINTKLDSIKADVKNKYNSLSRDSQNNCLLSFSIIQNSNRKYLGDFEIFREIMKVIAMEEFWMPEVPKEIANCFLCREEKEVSRPRKPFSFYTVNPIGFAANLSTLESWKQLPICDDCALLLKAGRNFLDDYLSKNFYGYGFYVIPNFIFGGIKREIIKDIRDLNKREYSQSLLGEEDDILDLLKGNRDIISLIFVFYKSKRGGNFDIVKYLEDIPPSWIKKLFDGFNSVNRKTIFREENLQSNFGDNWERHFNEASWKGEKLKGMNLAGMVWSFFPTYQPRKDRNLGLYTKDFLDVIGDILDQNSIKEDLLMDAFVREIRESHVNEKWDEKLNVFKSLYLRTFLNQVDLIKGGSMGTRTQISTTAEDRRVEQIEEFFNEFSDSFDENSKRVLFLEGVLTRFLLDIQARKRGGSTPFRSKLHGLKLDQVKVKALFPEIIEKLKQYDAPYYSWLEELISQYFVAADNDGWRLSKDEINYYFALGLNMGRQFKPRGEKDD